MASKAKIEKFGPQNKSLIRGRVQHTRTGACTSTGRCYHGMIQRPKVVGANKKKGSAL